jgi:hypothetical protein
MSAGKYPDWDAATDASKRREAIARRERVRADIAALQSDRAREFAAVLRLDLELLAGYIATLKAEDARLAAEVERLTR